ncbi:MAG: DUF4397 domain-containing protein [Pseudomonadota bacterium]
MRRNFPQIGLLIFAATLLAGCIDSDNGGVTGEGSIRALHAIPEIGNVAFLIEEVQLAALGYKDVSGTSSYDDLEYDFNFEILLPGDTEETLLATTVLNVSRDFEYTFVLAGTFEAPEVIIWEQFGRDWADELEDADDAGTEVTVMEVSFAHVDRELGEVDVYLESPGTSPAATTPRGSLAYGERTDVFELTADEYQLVFTSPGDPSSILFASDPINIPAATTNLLVIMADGGLTSADFTVRWIGTSLGLELLDINVAPQFSAIHAAFGSADVDVVLDNEFTTPEIQGLAFGGISKDLAIDDGSLDINVTPAGNPGVLLAQREVTVAPGAFIRTYIVGLPGEVQLVTIADDRRVLATNARVQIFQAAARYQTLDIYLVEDDVDIALIDPTFPTVLFGTGNSYLPFEAGSYNLVLAEPGTKTIVGGPFAVTLEIGRNYGIVAVDEDDITAANVLIYDQTPESSDPPP